MSLLSPQNRKFTDDHFGHGNTIQQQAREQNDTHFIRQQPTSSPVKNEKTIRQLANDVEGADVLSPQKIDDPSSAVHSRTAHYSKRFQDIGNPKESINTKIDRPENKFNNPKYDKASKKRQQQTWDSDIFSSNLHMDPHVDKRNNYKKVIPNNTFKSVILKMDDPLHNQTDINNIKFPKKSKNTNDIVDNPTSVPHSALNNQNNKASTQTSNMTKSRSSHTDFLNSKNVNNCLNRNNFSKINYETHHDIDENRRHTQSMKNLDTALQLRTKTMKLAQGKKEESKRPSTSKNFHFMEPTIMSTHKSRQVYQRPLVNDRMEEIYRRGQLHEGIAPLDLKTRHYENL